MATSSGPRDHDWMGVPVYRGKFDVAQAERLLWRVGFGPRRGEAEKLAKLGLQRAVTSLVSPGRERFVGPAPHDSKGRPLAPADAWGHDHCWWLDRMVRTSRPLVERMTLVWHDWFATSNSGVGSQKGRTPSRCSTRVATRPTGSCARRSRPAAAHPSHRTTACPVMRP